MTKQYQVVAAFLIVASVFISYSNTFSSGFQFDDEPNILNNNAIHIKRLDAASILQTFFSTPSVTNGQKKVKFNRPVAFFTFALNWYVGKESVWGYHAVNLSFHILSALLLFRVTILLIEKNSKTGYCFNHRFDIALIHALLWSLNPVHTQAVTYIVQRMAVLCVFFYLGGIYGYLKARESARSTILNFYLLLAVIGCMLSVGSKENGAMLPFTILLTEFCFPGKDRRPLPFGQKKKSYHIAGLVLMGGVYILVPYLSKILNAYQMRTFTLTERLMTQPRIVLFYLSLLFFPFSERLSVEHDVILSKGIFQPVTTFLSSGLIVMVVLFSILKRRRYPFFSYAVLFFFLNHLIESTILPLEMIFEHRNYLPSLFLFLPLSILLVRLYDSGRRYGAIACFLSMAPILFLCLFFSVQTFSRNQKWRNVETLWGDASRKAPLSARPLLHLAWEKAYGINSSPEKYEDALKLYRDALHLGSNTKHMKTTIYSNMAGIYIRRNDYQGAVAAFMDLLTEDPGSSRGRLGLAENLVRSGQLDDAMTHTDILLYSFPPKKEYYNLKGHILFRKRAFREALAWFHKSLSMDGNDWKTLYHIGVLYSSMNRFEEAEEMLKRSFSLNKSEVIYLSYIQNMLLGGNIDEAHERLEAFDIKYGHDRVFSFIKNHDADSLSIQPTFEPLLDILNDMQKNQKGTAYE